MYGIQILHGCKPCYDQARSSEQRSIREAAVKLSRYHSYTLDKKIIETKKRCGSQSFGSHAFTRGGLVDIVAQDHTIHTKST